MYILASNEVIEKYPYSIGELRRDNPQVSFPKNPSAEMLASYSVFPVKPTVQPGLDPFTQRLDEGAPVLQAGEWVQVWSVTALSEDEVARIQAEHAEQVRLQRQAAYQAEADPLFFKWQRGEATQQEWLDKIAEIKTRFPD